MIGAVLGFFILTLMARGKRRRHSREIDVTLNTGMPSAETALGRKAREILASKEAKLHTPPPVHGTARWAGVEDAARLLFVDSTSPAGDRALRLGTLVTDEGDTGYAVKACYPGHLLTVAARGQGKSATQIVENLRTYNAVIRRLVLVLRAGCRPAARRIPGVGQRLPIPD
jgi:hypothetical protein